MAELKQCPIPNCRGMANVYNGGNSIWWCECTKYEFVGPVKPTKQQAIEAWNRRAKINKIETSEERLNKLTNFGG